MEETLRCIVRLDGISLGVVEMLSVNTIVYKMGDRMLRGSVRQGAACLEAGHGIQIVGRLHKLLVRKVLTWLGNVPTGMTRVIRWSIINGKGSALSMRCLSLQTPHLMKQWWDFWTPLFQSFKNTKWWLICSKGLVIVLRTQGAHMLCIDGRPSSRRGGAATTFKGEALSSSLVGRCAPFAGTTAKATSAEVCVLDVVWKNGVQVFQEATAVTTPRIRVTLPNFVLGESMLTRDTRKQVHARLMTNERVQATLSGVILLETPNPVASSAEIVKVFKDYGDTSTGVALTVMPYVPVYVPRLIDGVPRGYTYSPQ